MRPRTTLIYEVRGKTRDDPRAQSPPMGPDLTDAPDRLAGLAEICILSGAGLLAYRIVPDSERATPPIKCRCEGF